MTKNITYSQIEEMLYFSLKESIEFAKTSNEDYGVAEGGVEEKLVKAYKILPLLASRVHRPVFWYLSDSKIIVFDGCNKFLLDKTKKISDDGLKAAAGLLMDEHYGYLKTNFKMEGYEA